MFPQKKTNDIIRPTTTDLHSTLKSKKRKRSETTIDSSTPRKTLVTLKLDPQFLSRVTTAPTDYPPPSPEPLHIPHLHTKTTPPILSDSNDPTSTPTNPSASPKLLYLPPKPTLCHSMTLPTKSSNSTELRDSSSSDKNAKLTTDPPLHSASAIAHDARVDKVHSDGTLQITPCDRCFTSRKQCIKHDSSKSCSWCLQVRKRCEGAIELGKWTEVDGKRVILLLLSS